MFVGPMVADMVDTKTRLWSETCACSWRPECLHFQLVYSWWLSRSYCSPPSQISSTYDKLLSLKWFSHVTASTRGWRTTGPSLKNAYFFRVAISSSFDAADPNIYIFCNCLLLLAKNFSGIDPLITQAIRVQDFRICFYSFIVFIHWSIMYFSTLILSSGLVRFGLAAYSIKDNYDSTNWLDMFTFDTVSSVACPCWVDHVSTREIGRWSNSRIC